MNKQAPQDRLATLEARIDALENLPAIESALAAQRATAARDAERQRLGGIAARRDHAEVARCSAADQQKVLDGMSDVISWCLACPADMDPMAFAPALRSGAARDQLEAKCSELPRRVKFSAGQSGTTTYPQPSEINAAQYQALAACGLLGSVCQINGVYAFRAIRYEGVYTLEQFRAIESADAGLRSYLASGAVECRELSRSENEQHQLDLWRTVAAHNRTSFPRRKREPNTETQTNK